MNVHKMFGLGIVFVLICWIGPGNALAQAAACERTYTVQPGDWLSTIAYQYYQDVAGYRVIADATRAARDTDDTFAPVTDANVIAAGDKLCVPVSPAGVYTANMPAADASGRALTLDLKFDGSAALTSNDVGKGTNVQTGTWTGTVSQTVVSLTQTDGKPITNTLTLARQGDALRLTTSDPANLYGAAGLALAWNPYVGTYRAALPAAAAAGRTVTLALNADESAALTSEYAGKGTVVQKGTWKNTGKNAQMNLTDQDGKPVQESFTFELRGTRLVAVEYNRNNWGAAGLALNAVVNKAALYAPLTLDVLKNATLATDYTASKTATLQNGQYEESAAPGSASKVTVQLTEFAAFGDLNGDGGSDAAAIVRWNGGGSGTFYDLVAFVNRNKPVHVATITLGDRILPQSLSIQNAQVQVVYLDRKANEPFAAAPTVPVTKTYALAKNAWVDMSASALAGTYSTGTRAADAPGLVFSLTLDANGAGTMANQYIGKGTFYEKGTWKMQGSQVLVTFTEMEGKPTQDSMTLEVQGRQLAAAGDNPYGRMGLVLARPGSGTVERAEFGGVSFSFDTALGKGQGANAPAVPVQPGPALGGGMAASVRFVFTSTSPVSNALMLNVYKVQDLRALDPSIAQQVDALKSLLASKPVTLTRPVPALPSLGPEAFVAQARYLDFQGGAGVRYITQVAFAVAPVSNDRVFFTFQGLTNDGQYYISLLAPIQTRALPATAANYAVPDQAEFEKNYLDYIQTVTRVLDELLPASFAPDLTLYDSMIRSLQVK